MKIVFSNLLARGTKREKLANKSDLISDPAQPMTIRKRPRIADGSLSKISSGKTMERRAEPCTTSAIIIVSDVRAVFAAPRNAKLSPLPALLLLLP
jgi:hypothetical protein